MFGTSRIAGPGHRSPSTILHAREFTRLAVAQGRGSCALFLGVSRLVGIEINKYPAWIAAIARPHCLTTVTRDEHFQDIDLAGVEPCWRFRAQSPCVIPGRRRRLIPYSTPIVVAAVQFFATVRDEKSLLDCVVTSEAVRLFPRAAMDVSHPTFLDPADLPAQSELPQHYGIIDLTLGAIVFICARPSGCEPGGAKALFFNPRNWDLASPRPGQGIVDWNRTPALFWRRGTVTPRDDLGAGEIGSRADAMDDISPDDRRWVNRVMRWVRRKGVLVARNGRLTPEAEGLDIRVGFMNSLYALPDAMEFFRSGGSSRLWG